MKIKLSNITKYFILVGFVFTLCVFYSIMSDKEITKQQRENAAYEEIRYKENKMAWEQKRLEMELQIAKHKSEVEAQKQKSKPKPKPKANIKTPPEQIEKWYNECLKWYKENRLTYYTAEQNCACYAEGIADYLKNSTREEVDKYKSSNVYGIKVRNEIGYKCNIH